MRLQIEKSQLGGWTWYLTDDGKFLGTGTAPTPEKAWDSMSEIAIEYLGKGNND